MLSGFFLASRDSACLSLLWGGRVVERKLKKAYPNTSDWCNTEDWEAFMGIFEGGGVLYCHMAFEDLLYMRGRLEELGFPCKSVADSLWLQVTFVYMCRQMNGSILGTTFSSESFWHDLHIALHFILPLDGLVSTLLF